MSSYPTPTKEGYAPFTLTSSPNPSTTYQTYYKIYGSLHPTPPSPTTPTKRPLIIVHGGPGSTHDYVLPLTSLYTTYHIPLVFYDQLGSGESTHLGEMKGEAGERFWREEVFMDQLDSLVRFLGLEKQGESGGEEKEKEGEGGGYDVLGHSWGGMLVMRWVARRQPRGLKKLVVSDSPASMKLFVEGALELRKGLPEDVRVGVILFFVDV